MLVAVDEIRRRPSPAAKASIWRSACASISALSSLPVKAACISLPKLGSSPPGARWGMSPSGSPSVRLKCRPTCSPDDTRSRSRARLGQCGRLVIAPVPESRPAPASSRMDAETAGVIAKSSAMSVNSSGRWPRGRRWVEVSNIAPVHAFGDRGEPSAAQAWAGGRHACSRCPRLRQIAMSALFFDMNSGMKGPICPDSRQIRADACEPDS